MDRLIVEKMRADFALVSASRRAAGLWDGGDEAEAGRAVRSAIDAGDDGLALCWALWLSRMASLALSDDVSGPPAPAVVRSCATCELCSRPGRASGYCGGGRADLAPVYGAGHPLRRLPGDGGVTCPVWRQVGGD